jgi:hypothetical protein
MTRPTARAMAEVKRLHCPPPAYRPAAAVRATMRCTRCSGLLNYIVARARDNIVVEVDQPPTYQQIELLGSTASHSPA